MLRHIEYPESRKGISFLLKVRSQRLNFFVNLMHQEGAYAGYKILNDKVLLLGDAAAIQSLFQEKNDLYVRSKFIQHLKHLFSGGIFLSDGEFWRQQRHEAAPVFSGKHFPEMVQHMDQALKFMYARWDQKVSLGQPIDINLEMTWYSLDVALRYLFHSDKNEIVSGVQDNLGHLLREAETRIWALISLPQGVVMRFPLYRNALKALRSIVDDLIRERQKTGHYGDDLLSRAIKSYEAGDTSYKTLNDKIIAYLTSAHETTANALAWAFYEISQRPDIHAKILAEADDNLTDEGITYDTVQRLDYTRQVFDETLRLYPSVWTMSRMASQDDTLPLDDGTLLFVPKGTIIMLCPYAVHRRTAYWDNPMAFDPDRFSKDNIAERPRMAYFPFAGGARLCLGFRFAQMEAVSALASVLKRYQVSLVPGQDIQPSPNITLRPNGPIWCHIRHRIQAPEITIRSRDEKDFEPAAQECPYHRTAAGPLEKAA
jgi:cytochrome P450